MCTYKDWSFHDGLTLSEKCPDNCSAKQLEGPDKRIDGVTGRSRIAMNALRENPDVKNLENNLAQLKNLCVQAG